MYVVQDDVWVCADLRFNQNWKELEVKTIFVNETLNRECKNQECEKTMTKNQRLMMKKKCVLLWIHATTSENRAKKRVRNSEQKRMGESWVRVIKGHGDFGSININRSPFKHSTLCRQRTTADRQNWGNRISSFPSCFISCVQEWPGFLTFAVVWHSVV